MFFSNFWDPKFPDFQTGPGPGLGRAWAGHGRGGSGWAWAGLGWAWAGLGLCLLDVLNMFSPINEEAANIFSTMVPGSFICVFLASSKQASQLYFSESLLTDKHRTPKAFLK